MAVAWVAWLALTIAAVAVVGMPNKDYGLRGCAVLYLWSVATVALVAVQLYRLVAI